MREYWGVKKKATPLHFSSHATSILWIQGREILPRTTLSRSAGQTETKLWASHKKSSWKIPKTDVHNVYTGLASSPAYASRHSSAMPVKAVDSCRTSTDSVFCLTARIDLFSSIDSACFCRFCDQENHLLSLWPFISDDHRKCFNNILENNYKSYVAHNEGKTNRRGD